MKSKTIVIDDKIAFFKTSLLVHFGDTQTCMAALKKFNLPDSEMNDIKAGLEGKPCNGMVWSGDTGRVLMFLGFGWKRMPPENLAVLCHECLHAAFRLLDYCGIQTAENEELLAMTQQLVLNSILAEL